MLPIQLEHECLISINGVKGLVISTAAEARSIDLDPSLFITNCHNLGLSPVYAIRLPPHFDKKVNVIDLADGQLVECDGEKYIVDFKHATHSDFVWFTPYQ